MRKYLLIFISIFLYANTYKSHKVIELINEIEHKKVKFIPLIDYNIFPVDIDNKVKIQQYIKEQSEAIDVRAIGNKMAYINNKWYKEGEKMGNIIIKKISNNCVYFLSKDINKQFYICISPNLVKVNK